jgi:hypothetical protein
MQNLTTDVTIDPNFPHGEIWIWDSYDSTISVSGSAASVTIWGDFTGALHVEHDLMFLALGGSRAGLVDIGRDLGQLREWGNTAGDGVVNVGRNLGWVETLRSYGYIHVGGDFDSMRECYFNGAFEGVLEIEHDLRARLNFAWYLGGDALIHGSVYNAIEIHRMYWLPEYGKLKGRIIVDGDLQSSITIQGAMEDTYGDLSGGHIIINGSLAPVPGREIIRVGDGFAGTTEFICVDYDGWDASDWWNPAACIRLGPSGDPNIPCYEENTPALRLLEVTSCKGDMDNTGTVDFRDINPFVLALSSAQGYSTAFPGLGGTASDGYIGGSRVWHGDINANGTFGFDDINPFVALMSNPTCLPGPGDGGDNLVQDETENAGGGLSPEQTAAMLSSNVDPALYDRLVTLVSENVAQQDNEEEAAYWEAVYEALIE